MKVLGFSRDGIELYIPIDRISGIFQDETAFRYPELSIMFFGLMFINGEVVPVLDLPKLIRNKSGFEAVKDYSIRCSVVLVQSFSGRLALLYDSIKDIFESSELTDISQLNREIIAAGNNRNAFFVENTEIIEDIISGIRPSIHSFKEILLCPGKS